jgi:hypothetical protein
VANTEFWQLHKNIDLTPLSADLGKIIVLFEKCNFRRRRIYRNASCIFYISTKLRGKY